MKKDLEGRINLLEPNPCRFFFFGTPHLLSFAQTRGDIGTGYGGLLNSSAET